MTVNRRSTSFSLVGHEGQSQGGNKSYQAIVLAAAGGDHSAFAQLVKRFKGMALTTARRWFDDTRLVEDAVQEAFLNAFVKLSGLRDASAFPSWFKKILHNCCYRLKKKQRTLLLDDWEALDLLPDPATGPYDQMVSNQSLATIAEALQSFDSVSREACIQRYIGGKPYKEIAEALQVPVGTVKSRLHDSRSRLTKICRPRDQPVIRVGYLPITDHLLAMVGHSINRGPLEISLRKFLSWESLANSLRMNLLDAAFIMAPLAMALRNAGVPLVYVLDGYHVGSAITVRKGKNVARGERALRVGLPCAASTHNLLLSDMVGIDLNARPPDMKIHYRGPSYLLNALKADEIDAFFCAEPWSTKALREGYGYVWMHSKDIFPEHLCCILVVREPFLKNRGDLVSSYLRLLHQANEYLIKNLRRGAKIQQYYTGVSSDISEFVLTASKNFLHNIKPDRRRIESLMKLAIRTDILDGPCDLNSFLHFDTL